jgi:hypothetical protein
MCKASANMSFRSKQEIMEVHVKISLQLASSNTLLASSTIPLFPNNDTIELTAVAFRAGIRANTPSA